MTITLNFKSLDKDAFNVHFHGDNYLDLLSDEDKNLVKGTPAFHLIPEGKKEDTVTYLPDSIFDKFCLFCLERQWWLDDLGQECYDVHVEAGDLNPWTKAEVISNGANVWITPHFDHQALKKTIEEFEGEIDLND